MFLFAFLLCCVLQPLLHYYCVYGKRESLQRFVVEEGAKPAIFGSYSYDPVRQVFVPPPPDPNDNGTSKDHPPESQKEKEKEKTTQTRTTSDAQTHTDSDTQTHTDSDTQTETQTDPQSHQLITTISDAISQGQSRIDSFISTAGDTGTDTPDKDETILRNVPGSNKKRWREQLKSTSKNLTLNFI